MTRLDHVRAVLLTLQDELARTPPSLSVLQQLARTALYWTESALNEPRILLLDHPEDPPTPPLSVEEKLKRLRATYTP